MERDFERFVATFNHRHVHESPDNFTPADAYQGRDREILRARNVVKLQTLNRRRSENLGLLPLKIETEKPAMLRQKVSSFSGRWVSFTLTTYSRPPDSAADSREAMMSETYKGACFCGAVEFEVTGAPAAMGYCHCEDCAAWAAGPINAFSLWPPDSVRITKGEETIGAFSKTEDSNRKFCKTCGGHIFTEHPNMKLVDVYPNVVPGLTHKPTLHVNYASKTVSVKDGLPKFKDLPTEFGGSGETLPE